MICVAIAEKDLSSLLERLKSVEFAEIRIDSAKFSHDEVKKIFSSHANLIATCREGIFSRDERLEILKTAVTSGAKYVDIEIEADDAFKKELSALARKNNVTIILSYHNFEKTPSRNELENIIRQCRDEKADICKIATQCNSKNDAARLLSLFDDDYGIRVVSLGMGEFGKITRIAAVSLGSVFTFASAANGKETAPGQLSIDDMNKISGLIG